MEGLKAMMQAWYALAAVAGGGAGGLGGSSGGLGNGGGRMAWLVALQGRAM